MISLRNLTKRYEGRTVVDNVSFDVPSGTITVLVGASGSGKTTLLRMVNRLVPPTSGTVHIKGEDTADIPPHLLRRRIGYAMQGDGLFPHHSVARNIATVPRLLGWDRARIRTRVDELLTLFQMPPEVFRDRYPAQLSGGQRQRVGVARALAGRPDLLLMDEPFGALDPLIRAQAQADLLAIQRRLGATIILVTHDMTEAVLLADNIAVIAEGRLRQYAPPEEVLRRPADDYTARLVADDQRPFLLLSLARAADLATPGEAPGTPLSPEATAREALAEMLWRGTNAIAVEGAGIVTRAALDAQARA